MVWRVLFSLFLGAVILSTGVASSSVPYEILFPVAGESSYSDTFGDPRGSGTHEGVDILAAKMTPVVAAADGVVGWMHDEQGGECCAMQLLHNDGYSSWYIHLNNDTPGTDDGLGWGFAPGITTGVAVSAGQIIGYVGDSGNAEAAPSHLHFELRDTSGVAFDPYPSLLAARLVDPSAADEILFYRTDGLFKYYDLLPGGLIGAPINSGTGYTAGWSTIVGLDLEGDGQDEIFFYREDGLFKYYDILPDGAIGAPIASGTGYTAGWSTIAAIDLDGDGQDEILFYRDDGLFKYYDLLPDGTIGAPINSGTGYTAGWSTIAPLDLDGDGQDEILFYRDDGLFKYYDVLPGGAIGAPINSGTGYTAGWSTITGLDLEGDGQDEIFFYRDDGLFKYYNLLSSGTIGAPINSGTGYTAGWSTVTGLNLDG